VASDGAPYVRALCQDCLAEVRLRADEYEYYDGKMCCNVPKCEGDVCTCDFCQETLRLLYAGRYSDLRGHLRPDVVVTRWTPEGGMNR
jgi:hypothetical protein